MFWLIGLTRTKETQAESRSFTITSEKKTEVKLQNRKSVSFLPYVIPLPSSRSC